MAGITEIFQVIKTIGDLVVMAVRSAFDLITTFNKIPGIFAQFQYFVPGVVFEYIMYGIALTVVLVIFGRANK